MQTSVRVTHSRVAEKFDVADSDCCAACAASNFQAHVGDGRRKGPPGRNKIAAAHKELAALTPEERNGLIWRGIGPGDSYVGIWRLLNLYRSKLVRVQEQMTRFGEGSRTGGSGMTFEEKEQVYLDRIEGIYRALLPLKEALHP
jgi:hypothetical protein